MKIWYQRVSTAEQTTARQDKTAEEVGAEKIFTDKASGKNTDRPQFKEMMNFVREGDTVMVSDISRIARNTRDLLSIVDELNKKGVAFVSLKENIDTDTPQGKFMLTVFGAMAELERENILQRQAEGIALAKQQGRYKGRKPMQIDNAKFERMCREWRNGDRTAVSIQREFNITSTSFYKWVKAKNL